MSFSVLVTVAERSELVLTTAPFPLMSIPGEAPEPVEEMTAFSLKIMPSFAARMRSVAARGVPALSTMILEVPGVTEMPVDVMLLIPPINRLPAFQELKADAFRTIVPAVALPPIWKSFELLISIEDPRPPAPPRLEHRRGDSSPPWI